MFSQYKVDKPFPVVENAVGNSLEAKLNPPVIDDERSHESKDRPVLSPPVYHRRVMTSEGTSTPLDQLIESRFG